MNVLIAAATKEEVSPLLEKLLFVESEKGKVFTFFSETKVDVVISGVGMASMAFTMGRYLTHKKYDFAINAGIAGAFNKELLLGDVVEVVEDSFSELGADDGDNFLTIEEMGLVGSELKVESLKFKVQSSELEKKLLNSLPKVKGITVNTVHGNDASIKKIVVRLNPDVESMEGAAFMYACKEANVPYIQIRSISNYVEKRDKSKWDIPLAINNLNDVLIKLVESL